MGGKQIAWKTVTGELVPTAKARSPRGFSASELREYQSIRFSDGSTPHSRWESKGRAIIEEPTTYEDLMVEGQSGDGSKVYLIQSRLKEHVMLS